MKIQFTKNDQTRYAVVVSMASTKSRGIENTSTCGRILSSTTDINRAVSFDDNTVKAVREYYGKIENRLFHKIELTI